RRPPPRGGVRRRTGSGSPPAAPPRRNQGSARAPCAAAAAAARRRPARSPLPLARPWQRVDGGAPLLVLLHVGLQDAGVELEGVPQFELQLASAVAQLGDAALDPLRLLDGRLHEAVGGDLRLLG